MPGCPPASRLCPPPAAARLAAECQPPEGRSPSSSSPSPSPSPVSLSSSPPPPRCCRHRHHACRHRRRRRQAVSLARLAWAWPPGHHWPKASRCLSLSPAGCRQPGLSHACLPASHRLVTVTVIITAASLPALAFTVISSLSGSCSVTAHKAAEMRLLSASSPLPCFPFLPVITYATWLLPYSSPSVCLPKLSVASRLIITVITFPVISLFLCLFSFHTITHVTSSFWGMLLPAQLPVKVIFTRLWRRFAHGIPPITYTAQLRFLLFYYNYNR